MTSRKEYDRFFRQRFPDVRYAMAAVYLWGLAEMEAGETGKLIVKSLDKWAQRVWMDRHTVGKALTDLHRLNLVEYKEGKAGLNKIAAEVRRRTMEEIQTLCPRDILNKFVPPDLAELADLLTRRGLPWGSEIVYPQWSVQRTGRIGARGAPPAGKSRTERQEAFLASLKPGEVLVEHDLKSAEPTIMIHELMRLGLWSPEVGIKDVYQLLADVEHIDRSKAKRKFMATAYTRAQRIQPKASWPVELRSLFKAVNEYRDHLWNQWPATDDQPRHAYTLGGRKILHDGRTRMHRGRVLSWRIQGTVVDIVMPCVRELIQADVRGEIRFYCQFHDSVIYAVQGGPDTTRYLNVIQTGIDALGIRLKIETKRQQDQTQTETDPTPQV